MAAFTRAVVVFTLAPCFACKTEDPGAKPTPSVDTPASPAPSPASAPTGDGNSMSSPIRLEVGKTIEGAMTCEGPLWFAPSPGPMDGTVRYELSVPEGQPNLCTFLNPRDETGHIHADAAISLCSEDPKSFALVKGPFAKTVAFFTIDMSDPNATCTKGRYRITLEP